MTWNVSYHPAVTQDLQRLGPVDAKRILNVIEQRIINGEPHKSGIPLRGELSGCRRIRVGDTRIVYRIDSGRVCVLIIAVGARRDELVYHAARSRH